MRETEADTVHKIKYVNMFVCECARVHFEKYRLIADADCLVRKLLAGDPCTFLSAHNHCYSTVIYSGLILF